MSYDIFPKSYNDYNKVNAKKAQTLEKAALNKTMVLNPQCQLIRI